MDVIATSRRWRVVSDGVQWILQKQSGKVWRSLAFVRSTRGILRRGMRDKRVPMIDAAVLLKALPERYPAGQRGHHQTPSPPPVSDTPPT